MPAQVAQAVTESVKIPVIGIGAGPYTDGQVLVYVVMLYSLYLLTINEFSVLYTEY